MISIKSSCNYVDFAIPLPHLLVWLVCKSASSKKNWRRIDRSPKITHGCGQKSGSLIIIGQETLLKRKQEEKKVVK